jgi:hypothetical protein
VQTLLDYLEGAKRSTTISSPAFHPSRASKCWTFWKKPKTGWSALLHESVLGRVRRSALLIRTRVTAITAAAWQVLRTVVTA